MVTTKQKLIVDAWKVKRRKTKHSTPEKLSDLKEREQRNEAIKPRQLLTNDNRKSIPINNCVNELNSSIKRQSDRIKK